MESNPLNETLIQRLANPYYKNWVKAIMCLGRLKEGLENFAQKESKALYDDIKNTTGTQHCGSCTQINNLCHLCQKIKREIKRRHNKKKPCWQNTDVQKWSNHWFIAKCYMNDGQTMTNSAKDSDISSLLSFITNCKHFQHVSEFGYIQRKANKVRENRNQIFHSGEQKLSDTDLIKYSNNMLEILKDENPDGKLKNSQDAKSAQANIEQIIRDSFVILREDELKVLSMACHGNRDWIIEEVKIMDRKLEQKLEKESRAMSTSQDKKLEETRNKVLELGLGMEQIKTKIDQISATMNEPIIPEKVQKALTDLKIEITEKQSILSRLEQESDSQGKAMDKFQLEFTVQKSDMEKLQLDLSSHSFNMKHIHHKLNTNEENIDLIYKRSQSQKRKCDLRYEQLNSRLRKISKSGNTLSITYENLQKRFVPRFSTLEGNFNSLECKFNKLQEEHTTIKQNMDILSTRIQQAVPYFGGQFEQHQIRLQQRDAVKTKRKTQPIDKEPPKKRKPESNDLRMLKGHGQWEYEGQNGPGWWHFNFPLCGGLRQSPVSIQTNEAVINSDWLAPIQMRGYESLENIQMYILNTGYTVQINLQGANASITGGGLTDVYIAQQFHFHWGKTNQRGSEHNIDGRYFPMEMHIVHYNTRYNNFVNALDKEGGLAVLAFLFEIGEHNIHFDQILNHIPEPTEHIPMQTFDMHDLFPENLDGYCRYNGSLTTPPCQESVIWFIFYETIEISRRQLNTFRHSVHLNVDNEKFRYYLNHFRPIQPLNGRKIYCRNKEW